MKNLILTALVLLLVSVACSANAQNIRPTSLPQGDAKPGMFFDIQEVGVGPNGYVSLTNFTSEPAGLSGLYLCQEIDCFALPDMIVEPGETVRIAAGTSSSVETIAAADGVFGELRPEDGEIALSTASGNLEAKDFLIYLQWGSTPHKLTKRAIQAGLWVEGGYAPTSAGATRLFRVAETGLWLFDE